MRAADNKLISRDLENRSRFSRDDFALPRSARIVVTAKISTMANIAAIDHSDTTKPRVDSITPPSIKPRPFRAFFEPVSKATHLNNRP